MSQLLGRLFSSSIHTFKMMSKAIGAEFLRTAVLVFRTSLGIIVGFALGVAVIVSCFQLLKPAITVLAALLTVLMKFFLQVVLFFLGA